MLLPNNPHGLSSVFLLYVEVWARALYSVTIILQVGMGTYLSTIEMTLLYAIDFDTTPNGFYTRNTRKRGKSFHYKASRNGLRLKGK